MRTHPPTHPTSRPAVLVGGLLLALATASPSSLPGQVSDAGYGVQPGDKVITTFFSGAGEEQAAIAGERTVDRDGRVFFPFLGPVEVEGLDATGIRVKLDSLYESFYANAVIDVTVQLRVNVTGAVRQPGSYLLDPSATIVDAVSEAGGAGLDVAVASIQVPADPSRVRLIRRGETYILDLRPDQVSDEVTTMRIQSGDWIFIPPRARSRIRDEVTFWGSLVSFTASVLALVFLVTS